MKTPTTTSEKIIEALSRHPKQQDALKELGLTRSGLHYRAKKDFRLAKILKLRRKEEDEKEKKGRMIRAGVTARLESRLKKASNEAGVSVSEYVRKVLEEHLK